MKKEIEQIVLSVYPHARIQTVTGPSQKQFWMLYDHANVSCPIMIGYSLTSEHAAWKMASEVIGKRMLGKLEQ